MRNDYVAATDTHISTGLTQHTTTDFADRGSLRVESTARIAFAVRGRPSKSFSRWTDTWTAVVGPGLRSPPCQIPRFSTGDVRARPWLRTCMENTIAPWALYGRVAARIP